MTVLEILNEYSLLIDYGLEDGAVVGDVLRIYTEGEPVKDLNGVTIGTLDQVKAEVEVSVVYSNFSICKKHQEKPFQNLTPLADLLAAAKSDIRQSILVVNKSEISHRKVPDPAPICVGDQAMLMKKSK